MPAVRAAGPDLMRALAILLVMLWHLPTPATPALLAGVKPYGWIGVDLFFVLSGYLIGTQLLTPVARGERPDFRAFFLRRAFRILPAFLVVLALYALFPILWEAPDMRPLWRFLTFTMNFDLTYQLAGTFSQAWSLCVEAHFYLILPLLVLLFGRIRSAIPVLGVAISIVLIGMVLRYAIWNDVIGAGLGAGNHKGLGSFYLEDIYYPTYCRLDGLVFGVSLTAAKLFWPEFWRRHADARVLFAAGVVFLAASLALIAYRGALAPTRAHLPTLSLPGAVAAYPLFAFGCTLILAALIEAEAVLSRWRLPGVALVAVLSYSLYLTHKLVMHLDGLLIGPDRLEGGTGFLIYFGTSLVAAGALWLLVERPFLRLRNSVLTRNHPGAATARGGARMIG
ncbi:MAG TPA: acyltransferase [Stellaceae bacterium]|nr:acyltransferase [Stellaceae bacterium]